MNTKDYSVLIKEFSERLPHNLYFSHCGKIYKLKSIELDGKNIINDKYPIEICYPYLRPMLSMTEEEKKEYNSYHSHPDNIGDAPWFYVDWLRTHHFDYRGVIEKGLAREAPEGMYTHL